MRASFLANLNRPKWPDEEPITGDFHWSMGEPAVNRYAFRGAAYQHARTDTAITLEVGDTVTFTYDSNGSKTETCYFIYSDSGADNVGYAGHDSSGDLILSNFTATMDGETLLAGEQIWNSSTNTDMRFHTVELTATARTDFRHIGSLGDGDIGGSGNGGTGNIVFAMFDFVVVTDGQTYSWPMHTYNNATQAEQSGTGNDVTINSHQTTRWVTVGNEPNIGTGEEWELRTSDPNSGDNLSSQQESLRSDRSGSSLGFLSGVEYMRVSEDSHTDVGGIEYSDGFTVECLVKYSGSANSDSRACGVISSFRNVSSDSLWLLGFDNFDDPTNANSVRPVFTLLGRGEIYRDFNDYSTIEGEVRSDVDAIPNEIYHLLATIRPSNDTAEFWVNGESIGSISIDPAWYGTLAIDSVIDGSRETYLNIGPRYLDGAWRGGQLSCIQDIRIHLLEADQDFVDRQALSLGQSVDLQPKSFFHPDHEYADGGSISVNYFNGSDLYGYKSIVIEGDGATEVVVRAGKVRNTGKRYIEYLIDSIETPSLNSSVGMYDLDDQDGRYLRVTSSSSVYYFSENSTGVSGVSLTFNDGDVVGIAVDFDAGTVVLYENNSLVSTLELGAEMYADINTVPSVRVGSSHTGAMQVTAAFLAADLKYAPPSGFLPWIVAEEELDLGDSSGISPASVNGLISTSTIEFTHADETTKTYNLGLTRNDDQEAERVGDEGEIIKDLYSSISDGTYCSIYTEDVIAEGEKKYIEFVFDVSFNNNMRLGFQVEGRENPRYRAGTFRDEMGYGDGFYVTQNFGSGLNNLEARGIYNDRNLRFDLGDIISVAVDYSISNRPRFVVYINGNKKSELTIEQGSNATGFGLRPILGLDRYDNESAYGDTARILTHQGVQTYAPPSGFTPLEV